MARFNTGNPVDSKDPRDLSDNAQNIDQWANAGAASFPDRLGVARRTLKGMDGEFQSFLDGSAYDFLGDYAAGIEVSARNQLIRAEGDYWRASAGTELPYTTTGAGMPEAGAFVAVGDAVLRQDLAGTDGLDFIGGTGTAAARNVGTGPEDVPDNSALGTAAARNVGTGPEDVPDNSALDSRGFAQSVASVEALRTMTIPDSLERIWLEGYYGQGTPGGGALYVDRGDTTSVDNGVTVFVSDNGLRLKRDLESISRGINVYMAGAVGDGVADDQPAIQSVINLGIREVFLPPGEFLTKAPIVNPGSSGGKPVSIRGSGRRLNIGIVSKILVDHAGEGLLVLDQSHAGVTIENLEVRRTPGFIGTGIGVSIDGLGEHSIVTSHCSINSVYSIGHGTGVRLRGALYGFLRGIETQNCLNGFHFDGEVAQWAANNVTTLEQCRAVLCDVGVRFSGNAGRNIYWENASFEGNIGLPILIEENTSVQNMVMDGVWFEGVTGPACMDLRSGANLTFRNVRLADNVNLIEKSTFNAMYVVIDSLWGGSRNARIGVANVTVRNYHALGDRLNQTVSDFNSTSSPQNMGAPSVSSITSQSLSVLSAVSQSGLWSKNYLFNWNIPGSSTWGKTGATDVKTQPDPLGGNTAHSWSGLVSGGLAGFPGSTEGVLEYCVWVRGKGVLELRTRSDNLAFQEDFFVDTDSWQRIIMRKTRDGTETIQFLIDLAPDSVDSLHVWRPGAYAEFGSIDTRPRDSSGAFEGGWLEGVGAIRREDVRFIHSDNAPPTAGTWRKGDVTENNDPSASGFIGFVCVATGTPGTWKGFGAIEV